MTSFSDLSLADEINRAIRDSGYQKPTLIQHQMIPLITAGRDVIGLSQTGTGKTAAFVLPMLNKLAKTKKRARRGSCSVLILSPTRELTNQIADTVRRYGKYVNYAQAIIVGGVSYPPQIKALRRGCDIVVATPGRALDHIESGELSLDEATTIILDEADQMLDFGFLPVIKKIIERLPEDRQSVLMSATMPKAVKKLAEELMTEPDLVEATPESKPVERVTQEVIYVERQRKNMALLEIVSQKDVERAIVFTRTKFGADRVQTFLNNYGILAVALHGNKSQGQRQRALGQFRKGEVSVLVATDIAGRGIDIDDVSHVINVDLPNVPESYVHRIGRTARAGREGVAISFCSKAEKAYLRDIEKLIGMDLPKRNDTPGKVPIKPSDATPMGFEDDRPRKHKPGFGGSKKKPSDHHARPSRKPKPVDPNLYFPDELTKGDRRSDADRDGGKPFKGKPNKSKFSSSKPSHSRRDDEDRGGKSFGDKPFKGKPKNGKSFGNKSFGSKSFEGKSRDGEYRDRKPRDGEYRDRKPKFKSSDESFDRRSRKPSGQPSGKPSGKSSDKRSGKSFGKPSGKPSGKSFSNSSKPKKTGGKRRFDAPAEKGLKRRSS